MKANLRIFLPFAIGYFVSYLLRNINAVIAPDLIAELSMSPTGLGLLTSAYLLGFGLFQLPLGLLLDHYGPRRVEAALLLVAAAGCAIFATGSTLFQLIMGRALIGLGVSACLMASYKAFTLWFAPERQASLNAAVMTAGALGALTATRPLVWLLPHLGWRSAYAGLIILVLLAAGLIFSIPEHHHPGRRETLNEQIRGLLTIFTSRTYWRYAPQAALITGGFMAMQGLWAVPWLMQVSQLSQKEAAQHLLLMGLSMLGGLLAIALGIRRLERANISAERLLGSSMILSLCTGLLIVLRIGPTQVLWAATGFFFAVGNLVYALLTRRFPLALAGRVNTALNMLVFAGAFVIQWGFGWLVDLFIQSGAAPTGAYIRAYALLLVLQTASCLWYLHGARTTPTNEPCRGRRQPAPP